MVISKIKFLKVVIEDPMNQVASGRRMFQQYVMETTEEKENLAK